MALEAVLEIVFWIFSFIGEAFVYGVTGTAGSNIDRRDRRKARQGAPMQESDYDEARKHPH